MSNDNKEKQIDSNDNEPNRVSDLVGRDSMEKSQEKNNNNNNNNLEGQNITLNSTNIDNNENNKHVQITSSLNKNINIDSENQDDLIGPSDYDTLDESVVSTIKRDLFRIYNKLKHVIIPRMSSKKYEELQNWDLWGPLIFCFILGIALSTGEHENDEGSIFIIIFAIFWIGGVIISFNANFLGTKIGICQMICLLGYCIFPIVIVSILIAAINIKNIYAKLILVSIGFIWSCLSSVGFVSGLINKERKIIACIPVFLFYLTMSIFVLNY